MMMYKVTGLTEKDMKNLYIESDREVCMKTVINKVTIAQGLLRFLLVISLMTLFVFIYSNLYSTI